MLTFQLITPERVVFQEEVYEVILPTQTGQIAVFPNHVPLISLVKAGIISLRKTSNDPDNNLEHVAVSGGFVEITKDKVKVLADSAEKANEINELKVQEAKQRALELKEKAEDDVSLADATAALEKSLAHLKLLELTK